VELIIEWGGTMECELCWMNSALNDLWPRPDDVGYVIMS